ncbi:MAG: NADPH:quinone oxidoreductase [Ponticaulis sp.]|nr:NADPH:quinone oxidoreductase [Ponticaulis sp.]|tara:strand:- start:62344 stop:63324 length:981 start_codon:yes stop_codon:yes gene_type:complete
MRAFVCKDLSDDLSGAVLVEDWPEPDPGAGEVKVQVRAASLNFPDILMCQGKYQHKPDLPFVVGMELAGEVVACGEGVDAYRPGDRVCGGFTKTGAFADYAVLKAEGLRRIPDNFDFAQAAAYGAAYLTAYVALVRRGRLDAGETLLVHGASGGVGMAAVDVGRHLGAKVIATSSSDRKLELLSDYGADHVINIRNGFREKVKELTAGRGADVIYDSIGGDVFDESTRCIAFDGRLLVIGFMSGRIAEVKTNIPLIKGFSVVGVRAGEYGRRFPERGRENLDTIWRWAADGKMHPYIGERFSLPEIGLAIKKMMDRNFMGKLIIEP